MEYTTASPFIPNASVVRYANSIFEARIHLPGAAAHIDVVPHENFILVTGSLSPRVHIDAEGKPSTLVYTDQPCGVFGRDIPVNLTAGTELVVLSARQDCDDYIVRYTIRNSITPRANCADYANAAAGTAAAGCKCPPGMKGTCGGASAGVTSGHYRPGSHHIAPSVLGRVPVTCGGVGYAYGGSHGCTGYNYTAAHTSGFAHIPTYVQPGDGRGFTFHTNGGATF